MPRKKLVGKKYQAWAKNVAIKHEILFDPEQDADILAYMESVSYSKHALVKKALRYYMATHH